MPKINNIVFDVGQVLIFWDREIPFRHLIPDNEERAMFLDKICTPEWNLEQDRGRAWQDAEDVLIAQHPDHEVPIRGFRKHWIEMIPHSFEDSVAVFNGLIERDIDVTLLTNFHQDTFPLAKQKFPFLNNARGETVSGEIKLIKPDKAIYDHHVAKHDLDPTAILFFDDSQKNVDGARKAGWQAELFVSAEQMARDLARYGVNI